MPHFVVDISENILKLQPAEKIISIIHDTAESTGLFAKGNIKVRLNPFSLYTCGGTQNDFIHVFAHIMGGRTTEQKKDLSDKVMRSLKPLFPDVPVLSINVYDLDPATYSNRDRI
jgi:5-carboxymethyl-2-hydroxymuconate isomerase